MQRDTYSQGKGQALPSTPQPLAQQSTPVSHAESSHHQATTALKSQPSDLPQEHSGSLPFPPRRRFFGMLLTA
jgi:hypothetical protein